MSKKEIKRVEQNGSVINMTGYGTPIQEKLDATFVQLHEPCI